MAGPPRYAWVGNRCEWFSDTIVAPNTTPALWQAFEKTCHQASITVAAAVEQFNLPVDLADGLSTWNIIWLPSLPEAQLSTGLA
jgi:hypothetical protein